MNSFSLLRTNVSLTTNIQIMVDSEYNLYMESIDSNSQLSLDEYKKVQFSVSTPYDKLIPRFYRNLPPKFAYHVKFDDDQDKMFSDYSYQYDDIYQYGCSSVKNTDYNEEFECFAPLHFDSNKFPTNFIIFRVDGAGLLELNKDNFKSEIIDKFKVVKLFDLTSATPIGQWLENSFKNDGSFPKSKFDLDVRSDEFSEWYGIDYVSGGYTSKSLFLKDALELESSFFDFDKMITDGYQTNKIVYPNILNLNFLSK